MPVPSRVYTELPLDVREELDQILVEKGFSGYEKLSNWLSQKGFTISKSSLQRYGKKLEKRLEAIRAGAEQAKAIAEAFPDEEDLMATALTRISQQKYMDLLDGVDIEEILENGSVNTVKNLPKLTNAIARLNQSSVNLKKHQREVREKALEAAAEVVEVAVKGGLSDTAVDEIKAKILGVAK